MHTSITALYAAAALSGWGGVTVSHFRLQNNLAAKMTGCLFWILIHAIYYNKLNALQASAHSSHADSLLKHTADVQADVLPRRYALVLLHFTMARKSYTNRCLDEDMDELAV